MICWRCPCQKAWGRPQKKRGEGGDSKFCQIGSSGIMESEIAQGDPKDGCLEKMGDMVDKF